MKIAYTVTSPDARDDPVLAWNAPLEAARTAMEGMQRFREKIRP